LIGGLAMLCFTKAFGTVFLGTQRSFFKQPLEEANFGKLLPMYAGAVLIIIIGIFPAFFVNAVIEPVHLFIQPHNINSLVFTVTSTIAMIGYSSIGFAALTGFIFLIRKRFILSKPQRIEVTWGCGYVAPAPKMQYTASSFVRGYRKLVETALSIHKRKIPLTEIFPKTGCQETHAYDKLEEWLIDYPLRQLKHFFNRFTFLQNGKAQSYILYGVIFILLVLAAPFVFDYMQSLIKFLNQI
jgi:hydrogenase-4 component B